MRFEGSGARASAAVIATAGHGVSGTERALVFDAVAGDLTVAGTLTGGMASPCSSPAPATSPARLGSVWRVDLVQNVNGLSDRIHVGGQLDIGGATLTVVPGGTFTIGHAYTIADGFTDLVGTFSGLGEGAVFDVGGVQFRINCSAGVVTLTATIGDGFSTALNSTPTDLFAFFGLAPGSGVFRGPGVSGGFFDPSAADGPGAKTITFTPDTGEPLEFSIHLTEATALGRVVAQGRRNFRQVAVGRRSRPQILRFVNGGASQVAGINMRVAGPASRDFRVGRPSAQSLAPAAVATVRAFFRPRQTGARRANLLVRSDAPLVRAVLRGRGRAR